MRRLATRQRRAGRVEGTVGLWLSVKTNAPPGATIAVVSGGVFALAAIAKSAPRPGRRGRARGGGARSRSCSPPAAAARVGGRRGELKVVATTTQIGDFVREVGGGRVEVDQILQPNTDPHDYEPRPSDVEAPADAQRGLRQRRQPRRMDGQGRLRQRQRRDAWWTSAPIVPERLPGESTGAEASRYDPHWWHDPRNAEAAVRQIERGLAAADPSERDAVPAQRERLPGEAESARPRHRRVHRLGAARLPQAGHRPRRLRLLRQSLRDRGDRRRHSLADDPGPAFRQGPQRPGGPGQARAGEGGLPRELAQPEAGRDDRPGDRGVAPTTPSTATRSAAEGSSGATYLRMERRTPTRWCGASRGGARGCAIPGV